MNIRATTAVMQMIFLKKRRIDLALFQTVLDRDVEAKDEPLQSTYLNVETGDIIWLYANDDVAEQEGVSPRTNKQVRMKVESSPERYLPIPGRTRMEQLRILQEFLDSDWTIDPHVKEATKRGYAGTIAGWLKRFKYQGPVKAYYSFKRRKLEELGKAFLHLHGIEPEWR